jgi:hypothetical protein
LAKNTIAKIAVERLKNDVGPRLPNNEPEAPLPKAAPASAPLPCCNNTKAIKPQAARTCTTRSTFAID